MEENTLSHEIKEVLTEMGKNTPGTEAYDSLVKNLVNLKKLENETKQASSQMEVELIRAETEAFIADERAKTSKKEAILGFAKTALTTVAAVAMGVFAVYSEETKIVAGKAWNMATKILR